MHNILLCCHSCQVRCGYNVIADSNVHGANMGPTWGLSAPDGPHAGPINFAIRDGHIDDLRQDCSSSGELEMGFLQSYNKALILQYLEVQLSVLPISFAVALKALGQLYDCPSAIELRQGSDGRHLGRQHIQM